MGLLGNAWAWAKGKWGAGMAILGPTQKGVPWPPKADAPRLAAYERNTLLYAGAHQAVYASKACGGKLDGLYKCDPGRPFLDVNLLMRVSDLLANRLFGEDVQVASPAAEALEVPEGEPAPEPPGPTATQEYLDYLYRKNELGTVALNAATSASYKGDAVLKVRYAADEKRIVIEDVDPERTFVEVDALNSKQITAVTLAQILRDNNDACYLWQERHEMREGEGWITNKLFALSGNPGKSANVMYDPDEPLLLSALDATANLPEEQATGVDALLVTIIPNKKALVPSVWGRSDYAGIDTIQGELDNRYTQRAEILDKHADPLMWGPHTVGEDGTVDMGREAQRYLNTTADGGAPAGYITWDGRLENVEEELRELTEKLAIVAGIDIAALMPPQAGGPISGRALRLSQTQTQATVQAKQRFWTPGIQNTLSVATKLANVAGVELEWKPTEGKVESLEPEDVTVTWADGLPTDSREVVEEETMKLEAGIQSREGAIQAVNPGMDEQGAAELLADIEQDARLGAPSAVSAAPLGGLGGLGIQPSTFTEETEEV